MGSIHVIECRNLVKDSTPLFTSVCLKGGFPSCSSIPSQYSPFLKRSTVSLSITIISRWSLPSFIHSSEMLNLHLTLSYWIQCTDFCQSCELLESRTSSHSSKGSQRKQTCYFPHSLINVHCKGTFQNDQPAFMIRNYPDWSPRYGTPLTLHLSLPSSSSSHTCNCFRLPESPLRSPQGKATLLYAPFQVQMFCSFVSNSVL